MSLEPGLGGQDVVDWGGTMKEEAEGGWAGSNLSLCVQADSQENLDLNDKVRTIDELMNNIKKVIFIDK